MPTLLPATTTILFPLFCTLFVAFLPNVEAIQCYSGSQLQIIECPSLSCIKQTLGLDTVRYCDGTGVSSICQTYRVLDTCQNIPNLGYICCCSDQLCNSAIKPSSIGMLAGLAVVLVMGVTTLMASHF